jgi:L-ascorbate metabolism protein UlaG (beta-lactamase superfamily)
MKNKAVNYFSICALFVSFLCSCNKNSRVIQYKQNPGLKTIKAECMGNACRGKVFVNYQEVPLPGFGKVLKWKMGKNPQKLEKKHDKWLPQVIQNDSMFTGKHDKIVWLGHATFLITLNGKNMLTDPVFNDIPFVKRLIGIPCNRASVCNIDYVLLSHGHFDHCDKESFKTLQEQNPQMQVFAPLNSTRLLHSFHNKIKVQEAGWYQEFKVDDDKIEIFYMPAFHWYKRGVNDDNTILWGSFIIKYREKTIFFMGDSGYNTHFKEIASFFPDIDICLMGVGAYKPDFMMRTSHTSPQDAVTAFNDLGGKTFVPMHYGTYDLADEPLSEPLKLLDQLNIAGPLKGRLRVLKPGEVLLVE